MRIDTWTRRRRCFIYLSLFPLNSQLASAREEILNIKDFCNLIINKSSILKFPKIKIETLNLYNEK